MADSTEIKEEEPAAKLPKHLYPYEWGAKWECPCLVDKTKSAFVSVGLLPPKK